MAMTNLTLTDMTFGNWLLADWWFHTNGWLDTNRRLHRRTDRRLDTNGWFDWRANGGMYDWRVNNHGRWTDRWLRRTDNRRWQFANRRLR
jgi:hypothetical protein